jgi:mono/diheme cytochrome c family protein
VTAFTAHRAASGLATLAVLAGALSFTAACAGDEPTTAGASGGAAPPPAFAARCASCHGADGRGSGDVPSLASAFATWEAEGLALVVREGLEDGTMPAFPPDQLPEDELAEIVDWLARLAQEDGLAPDGGAGPGGGPESGSTP